jgi:hypothetical protein
MTTQDLLLKILSHRKTPFELAVDEHRIYGYVIEDAISDILKSKKARISNFIEGQKTIDECIEKNSIAAIRIFPDGLGIPLTVIHWDLETVLKKVCKLLGIPLE